MWTPESIRQHVRSHRPRTMGQYARYAVLLPLVFEGEEPLLLFQKRSAIVRQAGETSLPGGRIEEGETPQEAVLRETQEELLVRSEQIELYGAWNPLVHYANLILYPFVGQLHGLDLDNLQYNEECESLFTVPLKYFRSKDPKIYTAQLAMEQPADFPYELLPQARRYPFRKGSIDTPFWVYDGHVIWGLTARIVQDFVESLQTEGGNR